MSKNGGYVDSPIGRVNFNKNKQQRVLTVGDPDDEAIHSAHQRPDGLPQGRQPAPNGAGQFANEESFSNAQQNNPQFHQETVNPYASEEDKLDYQKVQEMRTQSGEQKKKISATSRNILEVLTGIARLNDVVDVDGVKFSIRSLKTREMNAVVSASLAQDVDATQRMYLMRLHTLVRALYEIDGQDVNFVLGTEDLNAKMEILEEFDEALIIVLYDRYNKMVSKNNKRFEEVVNKDPQALSGDVKK